MSAGFLPCIQSLGCPHLDALREDALLPVINSLHVSIIYGLN
jgi:hypothetical protein